MNFSVLDWNIQGNKYYTRTNLKKIRPFLEETTADIICLQEGKEVVEKLNSFTKIKNYYCVSSSENEDGANVILSKFPVVSSGIIVCPNFANKFSGKAIWANIQIGDKIVKIYNCHFGIIGVGPQERAKALKFIINDSKSNQGATIICGDFNTTIPAQGWKRKFVRWFHNEPKESLLVDEELGSKDERYYFNEIAKKENFCEVTEITKSTWSILRIKWEIFHLKLDWFFVRGLETPKIVLNKYVSDHRAIFVECRVD